MIPISFYLTNQQALDKENEKKIMRTIYELTKKITIVMSTHKINYLPKNTLID